MNAIIFGRRLEVRLETVHETGNVVTLVGLVEKPNLVKAKATGTRKTFVNPKNWPKEKCPIRDYFLLAEETVELLVAFGAA